MDRRACLAAAFVVSNLSQAGLCHPVTIVSGQESPTGIAVDATNVYFTNSNIGTVMECATGGCNNAPTQLASGRNSAWSIVADVNQRLLERGPRHRLTGQISKCAIGGCNDAPTPLATGQNYASGIAVDAANVYWAATYASGAIVKCAVGGCNGMPTVFAPVQSYTGYVKVDAANVYWSSNNGTEILAMPLGGGATTTLVSGGLALRGMAIDSACVYWADGAGTVSRVAKP